nr:retrovirus-related Pol polyprotein from transposon TNT 1-94 [Tanacetum cinerariifolium]
MLIFSHAPLFLWAEAIATTCFTQNRSIIHRRFNKTPYELINDRKGDIGKLGEKGDISFLHVFGAFCYPKNDREDIGKLGGKGDIGFFIGYSANSCAYRVYNRRTKKIMETMNVSFDELSAIDFEQRSSKPGLQSMTSRQINSGLDLTYAPSTITTQQLIEGLWYSKDSGFELTEFSDADYAGCKDTFKSTFGRAAGPQRNKTVRRCQLRKQNMCLYPLAVPNHSHIMQPDLTLKNKTHRLAKYLVRRLGMRSLSPQELNRLAKS